MPHNKRKEWAEKWKEDLGLSHTVRFGESPFDAGIPRVAQSLPLDSRLLPITAFVLPLELSKAAPRPDSCHSIQSESTGITATSGHES